VAPRVVNELNELALLLDARGNHTEAEHLFRRGLILAEKAFGPAYAHVTWRLGLLATFSRRMARTAEASSLLRRAETIRASLRHCPPPMP